MTARDWKLGSQPCDVWSTSRLVETHSYFQRGPTTVDPLWFNSDYSKAVCETVRGWVAETVVSDRADRFECLTRSILVMLATEMSWSPPTITARAVASQPVEDALWRRCVRVLSMVHELHKAGYQNLRVLPMLSPSGGHWRGIITFSDNVANDGYTILSERDDLVARYTSGQSNEYFGWLDAKSLNAKQLAVLFVERFPDICSRAVGCDWAYAGWLTDVLGIAELGPKRGHLVHLIQDWEHDRAYLERWTPPPPARPFDAGS